MIADVTGIDRRRLLRWAAAWCALSEIWNLRGGHVASHTLPAGLEAERLPG